MTDHAKLQAVLLDFGGVVGTIRTAFVGEPGHSPYRVVIYPEMAEAIREVKEGGILTALVTNNDREQFFGTEPDFDVEALFDVTVFSSDVGSSKPHPAIFQRALESLGVGAPNSIFLDDLPSNVAGAKRLGIEAIVIGSPKDAVHVLEKVRFGTFRA